ncbi:MAG: hypothetical protein AAFX45_02730 [Pseudomonadota bacterium]
MPKTLSDQIKAKVGLAEPTVGFPTSVVPVGMVTPGSRVETPLLVAVARHVRGYVQTGRSRA